MKTKHLCILLLTFVVLSIGSVIAQTSTPSATIVLHEEPIEFRAPIYEGSADDPLIRAAGGSETPFLPERLTIASLCASASSAVTQSRRNTIGGLAGMTVNTDLGHPAGWYVIPTAGWQWHHMLTSTAFSLWRGKTIDLTTAQEGQRGNRMVISATLQYPVSAYRCRITSTLTNIAPVEFAIGRDSQNGQELPFNVNFVGRDYGPDNILESTYDPETGIWTERGDDQIFSNGELPSSVIYDDCVRFGATVAITVGNAASMDQVKNQFITGTPALTAELIKDSDVIDTQTVRSEVPRLSIQASSRAPSGQASGILMGVVGGQDDVIYHFESTRHFDEWTEYDLDIRKGQVAETSVPLDHLFYRLKAILP